MQMLNRDVKEKSISTFITQKFTITIKFIVNLLLRQSRKKQNAEKSTLIKGTYWILPRLEQKVHQLLNEVTLLIKLATYFHYRSLYGAKAVLRKRMFKLCKRCVHCVIVLRDPNISKRIITLRVGIVSRAISGVGSHRLGVEYRSSRYFTVPQYNVVPSDFTLNIYIARYFSFAALRRPPAGGTGPWLQDRHQLFRQYGPTVDISYSYFKRELYTSQNHFYKLINASQSNSFVPF